MERVKNILDIIGLIALRKAQFYEKIIKEAEKRKIKLDEERVKDDIANMNNEKFMSTEEKRNRRLDIKTEIDSLGLEIESFMTYKKS